jgi:hypothetical protein
MPVAHACNPRYLGGKDQEDCSSKPARQIVCETLSQKTHHKKSSDGVAQGVGPEFRPHNHTKKIKLKIPQKTVSISFGSLLWGGFPLLSMHKTTPSILSVPHCRYQSLNLTHVPEHSAPIYEFR